jgi:hypothetical protein
MFWTYKKVLMLAVRRAATSWISALSLLVYALILFPILMLSSQLGIVGGFLSGIAFAACFSSYLELISQAVAGTPFRLDWDEFKRSFGARFNDVISVMFVFWMVSLLTTPLMGGSHGQALSAILGFAIAFFFNAVPELLYQGSSRSLALLIDSAKFVMDHPIIWMLPNVLFGALALWATGGLHVQHPVVHLIAFGAMFSSPFGLAGVFFGLPLWAMPLALFVVHFAMIFRGLLFREITTGSANPRLRAFQQRMR